MFDLTGKVALVAGGAGYLGAPICEALVGQGASVMVADLSRERAEAVAAQAAAETARGRAVEADMADEPSILRVVRQTVGAFGHLDILVNATYCSIGKRVDELTAAEFDHANRVNVTGTFLLARAAADVMPEGGRIILFASMYGEVSPDPGVYPPPMKPNPIEYGVGKAGVIQMTKYLAVTLAPRGILVNAVAPGPFPSPAVRQSAPDFIERLSRKVPLGRVGDSREIVGVVILLASGESSFMTGETINVNGGWTAW